MAGSLGTISGQVRLDVAQAIAGFAAVRTAAATSNTALTTASSGLSAFGKTALIAGGALSAAFALAIDKAADFEKKMDYFGAVNNATAAEMDKVKEKALELGRTSQFSAGQIADAFVEMGKAGVSATDITDGMADAMVNLASAADIKLTEATNIVTSQIQTYSLAAQDAAHVTDVLAGAANASIVDVSDLGVSLKYVGGVAHALGISFDSTVDALSLLGKAGIKGSTAGTSLRQIMVSLAGGTKKAKAELEELGIITEDGTNKFFNADGSAKSLADVFQILQDHTKGLTQEQQLMAFRTIFNNRALAAAEILTKAGAAGFAEMNSEISKTTAADVAAKRMDNLSGDIKKLKGNIDTLLIQAGTPFQENLRKMVQWVTKLVQAFADLSPETQTLIFKIIAISGATLTFLGVFALVGGTIFKAIKVFRDLYNVMKLAAGIIRIMTVATWEMTAAVLASPWFWVALAVAAVVAALILLYQKSETVRNIMNDIGRGLKVAFQATVDWFKSLPEFFAQLWRDITDIFNKGVKWVSDAWNSIVNFFTEAPGKIGNALSNLGTTISNWFSQATTTVGNAISSAWDSFMQFLANLPENLGYALGFALGRLVRWGIDAAKAMWDAGVAIKDGIVWFFTEFPGIVSDWMSNAYDSAVEWLGNTWDAFWKWGGDVYNATVEWFRLLPGRVADFLTDMYHRGIDAFNNFWSSTWEWGGKVYNAVIEWFKLLPGRVWDILTNLYNNAVNAGINVVVWAKNFGINIYNGFIEWVSKLPSVVWDIVTNVGKVFLDMMRWAWDAAKGFAKGLWEGFKDGLGIHSPSHIERAMWAITKVTGEESARLGEQVRTMQALAGEINETNPAKTANLVNANRLISMTQAMQQQAAILQRAADSLFPAGTYSMAASIAGAGPNEGSSLTGQEMPQGGPVITVNNYNPVAERGSDSAAKKLRTLTAMGAF
jgi:TP901 family phage tail tape measure protein